MNFHKRNTQKHISRLLIDPTDEHKSIIESINQFEPIFGGIFRAREPATLWRREK